VVFARFIAVRWLSVVVVSLILPKRIERRLREESRRLGVTCKELVVEALSKFLNEPIDPQSRAEVHSTLSEKFMRDAEEFLKRCDYVQASEKAWGAASQMVKAVAAKEGREIRSHRELHEYLSSIVERTGDIELRRTWSAAGELHRNFYEAWLPSELVKGYIRDVKELIGKLRKLLESK